MEIFLFVLCFSGVLFLNQGLTRALSWQRPFNRAGRTAWRGCVGLQRLTYCTIFWVLTDKLLCVFCASDMQYNLSVQQ